MSQIIIDSKGSNNSNHVFGPLHRNLVGRSEFIRDLDEVVSRLADTSLTVFITGETGTGKDIVARLLHTRSERRSALFVKVNCPALPGELLESELFGYEKGAFSGAHTSKPGRFELAGGGTIFLDEITDIPESSQVKLIQVLDGEPFMRVGGVQPIHSNARVVAATNVPIEEAVNSCRLRKDIRYRLSEYVIHVPPLRERLEDIPSLLEHFNFNFSKQMGTDYRAVPDPLVRKMQGLLWPGNVRELAARVREYVATGSETVLVRDTSSDDRAAASTDEGSVEPESTDRAEASNGSSRQFIPLKEAAQQAVAQTEKALIEDALRYTLWNRREAAKLLETSYSSLLRRIETYEIGKP